MVPIPEGLLRPDVARIVTTAIDECRGLNGPEFQNAARDFKRRLSLACGWHAGERFDQAEFNRAVALFFAGCGR